MKFVDVGRALWTFRFRRTVSAALAAAACAFLLAQPPLSAQAPDALPYSNGFLVAGNYVVGGIDLQGTASTGAIPISGVPANADILAAYLYWETITTSNNIAAAAATVQFRGAPVRVSKQTSIPLAGSNASCTPTSNNVSLTMTMFRADVRRLLPVLKDANGKPTGKRLVNDADLVANGLPPNMVTLPNPGLGNNSTESAGASLFVVYRDPSQPLRKIVVYDGAYIQPQGATMTQTLRGIYLSSSTRSAQITHIVASGAKNPTERLFFNGAQVVAAVDPFSYAPGQAASDRAWSFPTYDVSSLMPGRNLSDGYGEVATTAVDHTSTSPYDCLSWSAVVLSTAVQDADHDGLPDGLEDAIGGLKDPNGDVLNLNGMGASSGHKDLFVQMDGMFATPGTKYGAAQVPDPSGHRHLPTPDVLKLVGDTLVNAPVANPDGSTGITPHFDVGDPALYHAIGGAGGPYASTAADGYLVPSPLARGGGQIQETACDPNTDPTCYFPNYPGTVGWKIGFQHYRDQPICDGSGNCVRRFDRVRHDLFHYVLYAHTRAKPKTRLPCLDANGKPTTFNASGTCDVARNPDWSVPSSASGVADLPGSNAMITLGLWDQFTGSTFIQASTTLHELGHNLTLWHGGGPAKWGNAATPTFIEPNCKPNYFSSMSYLFQVHGLLDDAGRPHLDYSRGTYNDLDETFLSDGALPVPLPYRAAWYAPVVPGTLAYTLGTPVARKFCSGATLPNPLPAGWVPMGRFDSSSTSSPIDWQTDGISNGGFAQDIDFDGRLDGSLAPGTSPLHGYNDWAAVDLGQVGGGTNAAGFSQGVDDFVSGVDDFVSGVDDFVSGVDDFASGVDDFVSGVDDFVSGVDDFVSGVDDFVSGAELDLDTAKALGRTPPNTFTACVIGVGCAGPASSLHRVQLGWQAPNLGVPTQYQVYRVRGASVTASSTPLQVGTTNGSTTTFVDTEELPNGVQFTYFARAVFEDGAVSGPSNTATITATDDAPQAFADNSYSTTAGTPLVVVAANGVLANDTDDDSAPSVLRAVLVTTTMKGSVLLFNADGSFTYTPKNGFTGQDSFTYKANDGQWGRDATVAMSPNSNVVTVTIRVTK